MALTPAQLALCSLIFGAGVATQPVAEKVKSRAVAQKVAPKAKPASASRAASKPQSTSIMDCPTLVLYPVMPNLAPIPPLDKPQIVDLKTGKDVTPPSGGSLVWIWRPPAPAVPEPAVWGMMVSGFGFIGLALRRRKAAA
jgi:hypothetical protein